MIQNPEHHHDDAIGVFNVWENYQPGSFVEIHPSLKDDPTFSSVNFVYNLHPGKVPADRYTHALFDRSGDTPPLATTRAGRFAYRVWNRLLRGQRWGRINQICQKAMTANSAPLLHAHFGTTAARMVPTLDRLRESGVPVGSVVSFYGVDASATLLDPKWRKPYQEVFRAFDRLLVLTDVVKERFIKAGCPPEKLLTYNLPAGIEAYVDIHGYKNTTQAEKNPHFITAARFVEKKGYPILIDAFADYIRQNGAAKWTILGYGPLRDTIQHWIRDRGLTSYVQLIDTTPLKDFHQEYAKYLAQADIFLLPSVAGSDGDDEGGPALTLVYAQAAGLPVITTRFPGSEISVADGETGLFIEPHRSALLSAMESLAKQPKLQEKLGKNARSVVIDNFSYESQCEELKSIYRSIMQSKLSLPHRTKGAKGNSAA